LSTKRKFLSQAAENQVLVNGRPATFILSSKAMMIRLAPGREDSGFTPEEDPSFCVSEGLPDC
jgi:hypothetical protein